MRAVNPLRLLWLPNIVNSTGPRSITTESFFSKKHATILSAPISSGEFSVYLSNPRRTVDFFAHEADRFATASFESLLMETSRADHARSTGWTLIRGYYAAFFALHALIRLHGWACTRISGTAISSINKEIHSLYPGSNKVESGLYFLEVISGGAEVLLKKMDVGNGGSHEMLWSLLSKYLKAITDTALSDKTDPEANESIAVAIDGFLNFLKRKGGVSWLAQVRNRVNYSHEHGAWFPYSASTCDVPRIYAGLRGWMLPPEEAFSSSAADDLVQFSEACSFIVSLCRTTVEDLVFRSVAQSPFRLSSGRILLLAKQASAFN